MLGPTDRAAVHRLDVDEAGLAEPVEVEAHGVGVEPEALGEVLGRQGRGGPGELPVHGVAGLVAERLEHRELVGLTGHALDGTRRGHIFKVEACINQG